jgi:hypothetical protein
MTLVMLCSFSSVSEGEVNPSNHHHLCLTRDLSLCVHDLGSLDMKKTAMVVGLGNSKKRKKNLVGIESWQKAYDDQYCSEILLQFLGSKGLHFV